MELILKYFPNLTDEQKAQFAALDELYRAWNDKINVISRKDIDNLYIHHVLHSLAIAKFITFKPKADILDLGTGGGFPGIPLAILFPETNFVLIDSIGKKIKVAEAVTEGVGLKNVRIINGRAEEIKNQKFDFVVTRAVATFDKLAAWSFKLLKKQPMHAYPNGIIALKGRNVKPEVQNMGFKTYYEEVPILKYFKHEYFEEKAVVYMQA